MSENAMGHLTVRVPVTELEKLREYCKGEDLRVSQVIRKLVRDYIKSLEKDND